jgi:hypothetical protein
MTGAWRAHLCNWERNWSGRNFEEEAAIATAVFSSVCAIAQPMQFRQRETSFDPTHARRANMRKPSHPRRVNSPNSITHRALVFTTALSAMFTHT